MGNTISGCALYRKNHFLVIHNSGQHCWTLSRKHCSTPL